MLSVSYSPCREQAAAASFLSHIYFTLHSTHFYLFFFSSLLTVSTPPPLFFLSFPHFTHHIALDGCCSDQRCCKTDRSTFYHQGIKQHRGGLPRQVNYNICCPFKSSIVSVISRDKHRGEVSECPLSGAQAELVPISHYTVTTSPIWCTSNNRCVCPFALVHLGWTKAPDRDIASQWTSSFAMWKQSRSATGLKIIWLECNTVPALY